MTVKMTPVVEILQNVTGSCDFGEVEGYGDKMDDARTEFWLEVIREKSADTGFGHLVESILEHGFTGSKVGWSSENRITEGHHRIVAAILLGLDEIPTEEYGTRDKRGISAHSNLANPFPIHLEV